MSSTTNSPENKMNATTFDAVVPGAGIDAPMERRPGVPMEADPPHPIGNAAWTLEKQVPPKGMTILKRKELPELTPVFGTSVGPRLLSGLMRRAAYKIPEHYTSHWFMLLFADRVDVLEHRIGRVLPFALPIVALAGVGAMMMQHRQRRSFLRRLFA